MRASEFYRSVLLEYNRDVTKRQFGNKLLAAWERGADLGNDSHAAGHILKLYGPDETPENIVNKILSIIERSDPTYTQGGGGLYVPWLAREYAAGNIKRLEDLFGWKQLLADFHRYKVRGNFPQQYKDIGKLTATSGISEYGLADVLEKYSGNVTTEFSNTYRSTVTELVKRGEATELYSDNNVILVRPLTESASKQLGSPRWCTAWEKNNRFHFYNNAGPLYILLPLHPTHRTERYQIHFESRQIMNEHDNEVSLSIIFKRFPELQKVFNQIVPDQIDYISTIPHATVMKLFQACCKLITTPEATNVIELGIDDDSNTPVKYYIDDIENLLSDFADNFDEEYMEAMITEGLGIDTHISDLPRLIGAMLANNFYADRAINGRESLLTGELLEPYIKWINEHIEISRKDANLSAEIRSTIRKSINVDRWMAYMSIPKKTYKLRESILTEDPERRREYVYTKYFDKLFNKATNDDTDLYMFFNERGDDVSDEYFDFFTREWYKPGVVEKIIQILVDSDPTRELIYIDWLARQYLNETIPSLEDVYSYENPLRQYQRYKNSPDFPQEYKDINRLNGSNFMELMTKWYKPPENKNPGKTLVVDDNELYTAMVPLDEPGSQKLGLGTNWCTAYTQAPCRYVDYSERGELIVLIPKKPAQAGEKYQIHLRLRLRKSDSGIRGWQVITDMGDFNEYFGKDSEIALGECSTQTNHDIRFRGIVNRFGAGPVLNTLNKLGALQATGKYKSHANQNISDIAELYGQLYEYDWKD
jgi:hypothetical protein